MVLTAINTGVDYLYPDGVPIAEVAITIKDIIGYVARMTSLAAQTDPWFAKHTAEQKSLSELHGEGYRLFNDLLQLGASDILPVFQPMQRWMGTLKNEDDELVLMYEYDSGDNEGKIIYRWQIMDTRTADFKIVYTSVTKVDIRVDLNNVRNVERYMKEALRDYVMMEFYRAIGYDKKYIDYKKSYNQNRQYVAYWAKNDLSLQTSRS